VYLNFLKSNEIYESYRDGIQSHANEITYSLIALVAVWVVVLSEGLKFHWILK